MAKSFENLEKAIVDRALREPEFMARLLADPRGFLKGLARDKGRPEIRILLSAPWAGAIGRLFKPSN